MPREEDRWTLRMGWSVLWEDEVKMLDTRGSKVRLRTASRHHQREMVSRVVFPELGSA